MSLPTHRFASLLVLASLAGTASACQLILPPAATADRAPVIAVLDHSPKSAVGKDDAITFTVVATDPEGQPLQYNWTATQGTLSANAGQVATWRPARADGSFEPGLTTISVSLSDGRQTTTGSLNVMIDAGGQAVVVPAASPSPGASAAATPTPAASPSDDGAIGSAAADGITGKVLFEEGFEGGLDQWEIASTFIGWNTLTWKSTLTGPQAGKAAAVLNDGDDEVKANTKQDLIWIQRKTPLDLTDAKLPRLRLYAKSAAVPANTVKFQVFFSPQRWGSGLVPEQYYVGSAFQGGKDWTKKDIDLSSLKGQAGYLAIAAEVQGNGSAFAGPMVDSVTVYDAGQ